MPLTTRLRAGLARDLQNVVAGLGGVGGDEHLAAVGFELLLEFDQQLIEAADGVFLDTPGGVALAVVAREFGAHVRDVVEMASGGIFELAAQIGVGHALAAGLEEIRHWTGLAAAMHDSTAISGPRMTPGSLFNRGTMRNDFLSCG